MKCPLAFGYYKSGETGSLFGVHDCIKGECDWWDDVTEQCCFKTLARGIVPIINDLRELVEKMPHAGQFLK